MEQRTTGGIVADADRSSGRSPTPHDHLEPDGEFPRLGIRSMSARQPSRHSISHRGSSCGSRRARSPSSARSPWPNAEGADLSVDPGGPGCTKVSSTRGSMIGEWQQVQPREPHTPPPASALSVQIALWDAPNTLRIFCHARAYQASPPGCAVAAGCFTCSLTASCATSRAETGTGAVISTTIVRARTPAICFDRIRAFAWLARGLGGIVPRRLRSASPPARTRPPISAWFWAESQARPPRIRQISALPGPQEQCGLSLPNSC